MVEALLAREEQGERIELVSSASNRCKNTKTPFIALLRIRSFSTPHSTGQIRFSNAGTVHGRNLNQCAANVNPYFYHEFTYPFFHKSKATTKAQASCSASSTR